MFGDHFRTCNRNTSRFFTFALIVGVSVGFPATIGSLHGQATKKPPTKLMKGSVSAVEQKGKIILIKWRETAVEGGAESAEIELLYTPKAQVRIKAPISPTMIEPGAILGADLTENSAGELRGNEFFLFLGISQGPSVVQNQEDPSKYRVIGQLEGIDGSRLMMNFGPDGKREVYIEGEPTVSAIAGRPEFLKKGAEGQIEYLPSKEPGKPATLVAMEVSREDPFDPEELKGTNVTKSKTPTSKPKPTTTPKSTTTKRTEKPVLKPAGTKSKPSSSKDPFGVLDK